MPERLSDRQVFLALLLTLMLVFGLIVQTRTHHADPASPLLWREQPAIDPATLRI